MTVLISRPNKLLHYRHFHHNTEIKHYLFPWSVEECLEINDCIYKFLKSHIFYIDIHP